MGSWKRTERLEWAKWATPKRLREQPIHRWFVFPHSYTGELVKAMIDEWGLGAKDRILDPFVGAGTTLVAAKEKGIPATGYDLSPLAVLASRVKSTTYDVSVLRAAWNHLKRSVRPQKWNGITNTYPELVVKALPGRLLWAFDDIDKRIRMLQQPEIVREFFRLALLACLPKFSRAVAAGGWLKWIDSAMDESLLLPTFETHVELMMGDIEGWRGPRANRWLAAKADARRLPGKRDMFSAIITSPPYPNRHDYTRVFGVELMFAFMDWKETRDLRYQSICSHPESHPRGHRHKEYAPSVSLQDSLAAIRATKPDPRVPRMLEGYFRDMYVCLSKMRQISREEARIGLVLGNAQYCGVPIHVDECVAQIGEQVGLRCKEVRVIRRRGNSAQQMARYGRRPSSESIVIFTKEDTVNQRT